MGLIRGVLLSGTMALCAAALIQTSGLAQPTMRVAVPNGLWCQYDAIHDVDSGGQFVIVVLLDSDDQDVSGAAFRLTPMLPGVLRLTTEYPTPLTVNSGGQDSGEFDLAFNGCAPACDQRELVRITYGDFAGVFDAVDDFVMVVSGADGEAEPPKYRDCAGAEHSAEMGGFDGGRSGEGVLFPDGSLILNATPHGVGSDGPSRTNPCELPGQCAVAVPVRAGSMSVLKARSR